MTAVWYIVKKDGTILHQTDYPNTVDVWLMRDWPNQLVQASPKAKLHVRMGEIIDWPRGAFKTKRAATWPYTISADKLVL